MTEIKTLGMSYWYELYLTQGAIDKETWKANIVGISKYIGQLKSWKIVLTLEDNTVRYFVGAPGDISSLSNNVEGIVIRPIEHDALQLPTKTSTERFVQYVSGGNILDMKEKYLVKRHKDLVAAELTIRMLNADKAHTQSKFYFKDATGLCSVATKTILSIPDGLVSINFDSNAKYMRKTVPKFLNIEKSIHMLAGNEMDAIFEVDSFPYFAHNRYLGISNYEHDKHSFIIGASGSGKSKLITLIVDRLSKPIIRPNYRIIVIDPHDSLHEDLVNVPDTTVVDFGKQDSTDLFPGAGTDLTAATELTATLFKSLLTDQYNPRLDRLLRFSLFTLMTAQAMSLENLRRFLTDPEYRNQIVSHVEGYVPQNITKFFGADYNEIRTQFYNDTILPIVSMVDEMQLQPSLVGESEKSLAKTVQENFLTVFSLNKVSMGEKVVKTVAGLLIQQIFLLAQAGAFQQHIMLFIDEVSVVQNPTIAQILAEARKFNLTVILTQQYFGQVEKDLRDAIFANVFNYYVFKVSEDDARALEGNLNMEIPADIVEEERKKGISEVDIRVKMLTELNPRECLVRVVANGQVCPCLKAKTVEAPHYVPGATKHLKQFTQALPEKFSEVTAGETKRSVNFSPEFMAKVIERADDIASGKTSITSITPKDVTALNDILSSHSSSRDNVKKRKAKP